MSAAWHYPRPALANQLTIRLNDGLFSRMAYMGYLGIGKTVFLVNDLSLALLDNDCIPVYISLWSNPTAPHSAFIDKLSSVVASLRNKGGIRNILKTGD